MEDTGRGFSTESGEPRQQPGRCVPVMEQASARVDIWAKECDFQGSQYEYGACQSYHISCFFALKLLDGVESSAPKQDKDGEGKTLKQSVRGSELGHRYHIFIAQQTQIPQLVPYCIYTVYTH